MAILHTAENPAYFLAHVGGINIFTDMTGRENATGYDLGYASRIQSLAKETNQLICSENLSAVWEDNRFFDLGDSFHSDIAKDGLEYRWKLAVPKDFEDACADLRRA